MSFINYKSILPPDYLEINQLIVRAFDDDTVMHTDHSADGPPGYNDGSLLDRYLHNSNIISNKILLGSQILGLYVIEIDQVTSGELHLLAIDPAFKNQHYGLTTWHHIEKSQPLVKDWIVETPNYSTRNHYFYTKKCGFYFLEKKDYPPDAQSYIFKKTK